MNISNLNTVNRQACEWVAKMHERDLTENEHNELKAWLALDGDHKTELRRMAQRWDELNVLTTLSVPADTKKSAQKSVPSYFSPVKIQAAIAAVFVIGLLALMLPTYFSPEQENDPQLLSYSTGVGEQREILLPDNSTVLLNTKSQFSVAYTPEYRDIYLIQGEAHFDVKSIAERPFRVFAGKSKVRAVGTAFSVYLKKTTVDITVTHGSVEIDSIRETNTGIQASDNRVNTEPRSIVKAGHAAEFDQLAGTIEVVAFPDSEYVPAWHNGKLKFSGEPLEKFIEEISRYSPLSIVILDSELRDLRIGGLFDLGETEVMFQALESGLGIKVSYVNENLVHLSANSIDTK